MINLKNNITFFIKKNEKKIIRQEDNILRHPY